MTSRARVAGLTAVTLTALAAIVGVVLLVAREDRAPRVPISFDVDLRSSSGNFAQVFWAADMRFSEERSMRSPLEPGQREFQHLRFTIPSRGVRWLRFDPLDTSGEVLISSARLIDSSGKELATFGPDALIPAHQIASIGSDGQVIRLVTLPGATDPYVYVSLGCLNSQTFSERLQLVTPTTLALACLAAVALVGCCVLVIARAAFGVRDDRLEATRGSPRWTAALWLATLFLIVFAAKLALMRANPVQTPFWDQWDGEVSVVFEPFHGCSLAWPAMFDFHNEHRVFFTRLLALGLLTLDGQWDPRLEQVANALLHSFVAVLLAAMLWLGGGRRRLELVALAVVISFALPFGWENTLIGFQSAFYFQILFSLLALWLTTAHRPVSAAWWLGWVCAGCALFTAAGGVFAAVAIGAAAAFTLVSDPRDWREWVPTIGAAGVVSVLGAWLATSPYAQPVLRAQNVADFVTALGRGLAWPWVAAPWLAVVMWLPYGALVARLLTRRARPSTLERFVVGLGIWVVLTAAAIAFGRGAGAPWPANRYMDLFSLGFVVNVVAFAEVAEWAPTGSWPRLVATGALIAWLLFAVLGVDRLLNRVISDLADYHQFFIAHTLNVRRFMVTGDVQELLSRHPLTELPYPDPNRLLGLLQDTYIRRILPAAVRSPLPVEPAVLTNGAFVREGPFVDSIPRDPLARSWWSLSDLGRRATGRFESRAMSCQIGGRLRFQVAGYLGMPGQYLALRNLRTGRESPVRPRQLAEDEWTEAVAACPTDPFEIVAIDDTAESWFGFREPVEIGWASVVAESLIDESRDILIIVLTLAALVRVVRWS
jgi:hypothetical protein